MQNQRVLVLDFGGQYNQLIARRVRECNVYCEVKPHSMTIDEIKEGVAFAHEHGAKAYMTLNIFAHNEDISSSFF